MTALGFNATPMIDVIFLLTIFFMLVSTFSQQQHVPMQLPSPRDSRAALPDAGKPIVINCRIPDADTGETGPVLYSLGPNRPEPLTSIAERLRQRKEHEPDLKVVVRADRRLTYAEVRAVMQILAEQDIEMLNVAAQTGEGTSHGS